jgi:hypothetical protein
MRGCNEVCLQLLRVLTCHPPVLGLRASAACDFLQSFKTGIQLTYLKHATFF